MWLRLLLIWPVLALAAEALGVKPGETEGH
jgi:hypothetical protein